MSEAIGGADKTDPIRSADRNICLLILGGPLKLMQSGRPMKINPLWHQVSRYKWMPDKIVRDNEENARVLSGGPVWNGSPVRIG
jgi:hypothetical protein